MAVSERNVGEYYWVKARIITGKTGWVVGKLDKDRHWWLFDASGWFYESELEEIGPVIAVPD